MISLVLSESTYQGVETVAKLHPWHPMRPGPRIRREIVGMGCVEHFSSYNLGYYTTIFGGPKCFGCGPENRIRLVLDCDKSTLEFRSLKEKASFWKFKLPCVDWSCQRVMHYPVVVLANKNTSATFCFDDSI